MVVNVDQLQAQVDFLEAKVKQMTDMLALYSVNGLNDAFDGTGNQVFGGGKLRLDKTGIQMTMGNLGSGTQVTWLDAFSTSPVAVFPHTRMLGYLNAGAPNWLVETVDSTNQAWGGFDVQLSGTIPTSRMYIHSIGAGDSAIYLTGTDSGSFSVVSFDTNTLLKLTNRTTDPGSGDLVDSMPWYRTDTDRYRVRANGITRNLTMDGTNTTLTIATGAVTSTTSFHAIDTEAAAATDDLDTISGGETGQVLYIHAANSARDVVAKDGTGNLKLAGDFTLNNVEDTLTLIFDGTNWLELCRSDNGA